MLVWEKNSLRGGESFPVFLIYKENKSSSVIIYIAILILVLAGFLAYLKSRRKSNVIKTFTSRRKVSKQKTELHLLESEAAVVKALKDSKGEMWQKQIQIKTGFSKAKLSRVIRNLESRGLVKRIPLGNTNKIKLK